MEKPENCAGYRFQRLFGQTMFFRNDNVTNKVVRPKTKCKKNLLVGKNNRINKTKELHYFLTSSFHISKSIFEGVFRGDFFFQRVFRRYFSSYL